MFNHIAHLLTRLTETNTVTIHWIPGHCDIGLNTQVDHAAKQARLQLPISLYTPRLAYYKSQITTHCFESSFRHTKAKIQPSHWAQYPPRDYFKNQEFKKCRGAPFRILTGHTRTNQHLSHIGIVESPLCRHCLNQPESPDHTLLHCEQTIQHTSLIRNWSQNTGLNHVWELARTNPARLERLLIKASKAGISL